ncbi:MAG: hypothetical protein EBZ18_06340, partial [Alphaproteobacteria bacterium]|nr:hypothetical protein [Alphaproteobacteria bacterium]
MDTADLIDRIRSLRERIETPAQATSFAEVPAAKDAEEPAHKPDKVSSKLEPSSPDAAQPPAEHDDDSILVLEAETEVLTKDHPTQRPKVEVEVETDLETDTTAHDASSRIASNLSAALSALDDDHFETLAAKGQVDQLVLRMEILESRLKKTQDMILTLNRSVGRLIHQEEDQKALSQTEQAVRETTQSQITAHQTSGEDDIMTLYRMVTPAETGKASQDRHTPDAKMIYQRTSASHARPRRRRFLGVTLMIIALGIGYILFGFGSTTSQPASLLPDTDAFLNDNERAVYSHIEMGMARPLGITSVQDFSNRMWEKGINLPEYYTCLIGALDISTKPMNEMMMIQLLNNPLRADFNPAMIDQMKARFESRYGSAEHYGGFARPTDRGGTSGRWWQGRWWQG